MRARPAVSARGAAIAGHLRIKNHGAPKSKAAASGKRWEKLSKQVADVGYTPKVAKEVRLSTQTVRLEQGEFLFPRDAAFLDDLKRELVTFGHSKHDDQVDSITQFVAWATAQSGLRAIRAAAERRKKHRARGD